MADAMQHTQCKSYLQWRRLCLLPSPCCARKPCVTRVTVDLRVCVQPLACTGQHSGPYVESRLAAEQCCCEYCSSVCIWTPDCIHESAQAYQWCPVQIKCQPLDRRGATCLPIVPSSSAPFGKPAKLLTHLCSEIDRNSNQHQHVVPPHDETLSTTST